MVCGSRLPGLPMLGVKKMDNETIFLSVDNISGFPKLIHQTWKVKKIPEQFSSWSSSWTDFNPSYLHHVWTDTENRNFIIEKFPELLEMYDNYDHHIKRVDAVRYCYLYLYGGIYCDLDFECLKPFDSLLQEQNRYDVILGQMGEDPTFHQAFPNAIMISKPKSDFWLFVIKEMIKRANTGRPECDTGPVLLTDCVNAYTGESRIKLLSPEVFYGISWNEEKGQALREQVLEGMNTSADDFRGQFPEAYAVTYWSHSWGGGGSQSLSKRFRTSVRSIIGKFFNF